MPEHTTVGRVLLMATDPVLVEAVRRLAAAAGCELDLVHDPGRARRMWVDAPVVLLDAEHAVRCARAALPRRGHVVVAVRGEPPPAVWQQAVAIGAEHVVCLPDAEPWLVSVLSEVAEGGVRDAGPVLAVVGGRGGAGASVFAAAAAVVTARDGGRAILVDCDEHGGGIDLVLGAEDLDGMRWPGLEVGGGRVPASALRAALPAVTLPRSTGALAVLSCAQDGGGPTPAAVHAVVDAGRRSGELVVCDVPRHLPPAAATAVAAADLTVLVVPADVRSCAAARRVVSGLLELAGDVGLVVRGPAPGGIGTDEVARVLGLPVLAAMRAEPGLPAALERGEAPGRGRGPLAKAARTVLAELDRLCGGAR